MVVMACTRKQFKRKSGSKMREKRTEKYEQARELLPDELKPVFDDFVTDYKFYATKRHGAPYVSYIVLADMIRAGWRLSTDAVGDESGSNDDAPHD